MSKKYVDYFTVDYLNIFRSISILISKSENEILERLNYDNEEMILFLSGILGILVEEKEFFMIDNSIMEKVLNIVCKVNDSSGIKEINSSYTYSILYYLRDLNYLSDELKNKCYFEFVSYNECYRDTVINTKKDLYDYLKYDYIMIEKLKDSEFDFDKDLFLASSYYLKSVIPDIYDYEMVENSLIFLEKCQDSRYFRDNNYKKKVNSLKKYFNSFKKSNLKENNCQFIKFKDKE